jgi:hypothetical protein
LQNPFMHPQRWFAWRPVQIEPEGRWCWFEMLWRKKYGGYASDWTAYAQKQNKHRLL